MCFSPLTQTHDVASVAHVNRCAGWGPGSRQEQKASGDGRGRPLAPPAQTAGLRGESLPAAVPAPALVSSSSAVSTAQGGEAAESWGARRGPRAHGAHGLGRWGGHTVSPQINEPDGARCCAARLWKAWAARQVWWAGAHGDLAVQRRRGRGVLGTRQVAQGARGRRS